MIFVVFNSDTRLPFILGVTRKAETTSLSYNGSNNFPWSVLRSLDPIDFNFVYHGWISPKA